MAKIKDGSKELDEGMHKFKAEGTDKIMEAYDDDIKALVDRFRAVREASLDYKSFSGLGNDMDGSVKFVYTIDGTTED